MTASEESAFRLRLAEDMFSRARRAEAGDPATAVLLARGAIENAAKAVLACFSAVSRSHEPAELLQAALGEADFPESCREAAVQLLPLVVPYGAQKHAQTAYGDESKHLLPSEIIDVAQASTALKVARSALDVAQRIRQAVFGL